MKQRHRRTAEYLSQQDCRAWQGRYEDLAQEAELAVPDHGHGRLHRRVHDVERNHRGEDELQIGVGHDEADLAVDLAAKIWIEADAHDQHPQQRPAYPADKLAAVAYRALHLAEPDRVEAAALQADRMPKTIVRNRRCVIHRVCSPPCRPNAMVRSRAPAAWSRISRPVRERNTLSRLGSSTERRRMRLP